MGNIVTGSLVGLLYTDQRLITSHLAWRVPRRSTVSQARAAESSTSPCVR